jgi:hypothetical protein
MNKVDARAMRFMAGTLTKSSSSGVRERIEDARPMY